MVRKTSRFFNLRVTGIWLSFVIIFTGLILAGCAHKLMAPPPADFAQKAIELHFNASGNLNLYGGQAHALVLCIYQLSDSEVFEDNLYESMGPNRLLACNQFDSSVTGRKRVIVQPGSQKDVVLDRLQGTRYLGIIAGYYQRRGDNFFKVVPIPVAEKRAGLFKKKLCLDILKMDINLDDRGIR